MAIKTILTEPNTLLRQISQPIEKVGEYERELMNNMLETMYAANGIGLSAIQIGVPKRIIVLDLSKEENKKLPMYFANPVIIKKSIEKKYFLSFLIFFNKFSKSSSIFLGFASSLK